MVEEDGPILPLGDSGGRDVRGKREGGGEDDGRAYNGRRTQWW